MHELTRDAVFEKVKAWGDELRYQLGEAFVSLAVYGSAAREDFDPAHSDVNLLLVVDRADLPALRGLAAPWQQARLAFRGAPFVMSREEVFGSRDVFPVKFHEIARAYQVVAGEDCLKDLQLSYRDLRHACESELRNIALKLRRIYLADSPDPRPLLQGLRRFAPQLLGILRVLLERKDSRTIPAEADLAALGSAGFGFTSDDLRLVLALRRQDHVPWPEVEEAFGALTRVLERLTEAVEAGSEA